MQSRKFFLTLFVLSFTALSYSQVNSPYSRYGLGNLFSQTYAAGEGMGGLSAAQFSNYNLNFQNPASYSFLNYTTFEVGAYANFLTLHDGSDKFTSGDGNLSYLALGFPVLRKKKSQFGISTGLLPFSGFQYNVQKDVESTDTLLGTQTYDYEGTGTLYQFYGGVGFEKTFSKLDTLDADKAHFVTLVKQNIYSLGLNASYLFGTLQNTTVASFPDQANAVDTKLIRINKLNGLSYNYGIGYEKIFTRYEKDNIKSPFQNAFAIGIAGNPQLTVNGSQAISWFNVISVNGIESVTDTLYLAPDTSGNITLPAQMRIGFTYKNFANDHLDEKKTLFSIGAEYSQSNWGDYQGFQSAGTLTNSNRFTLGAEITPKWDGSGGKPRAFNYRAGLYFGNSNLSIDGIQLKDYGGTIGFGIPIGLGKASYPFEKYSKMNVSLNIGHRGAVDEVNETYVNLKVGFVLNDFGWFIKRQLK